MKEKTVFFFIFLLLFLHTMAILPYIFPKKKDTLYFRIFSSKKEDVT